MKGLRGHLRERARRGDDLPDGLLFCALSCRASWSRDPGTCLPFERIEPLDTVLFKLVMLAVAPFLCPTTPRPASSLKLGFEYVSAPEPEGSRL